MQTAIGKPARSNGPRLFRRSHLAVEVAVVAAAVLTLLASYYRDPLTQRELSFTPTGEGMAYTSYQFDDRTNGGTSVAGAKVGRPLAWTCDLTAVYEYRYCGFGLKFDPAGSGHGIDLRPFEHAEITLHYEGPSQSLRVFLKSNDPRYLELGAISDEQVIQMSAPISAGTQTIEIGLDQFAVAEWWRDSAPRPSAELAKPAFHNVALMEFLTGSDAAPSQHRLRIDSISFRGRTIGAEAWYGTIALIWLLLIGTILLQRRQEASRWRAQLLGSMRKTVDTIPHMVWSLDRDGNVYFNRRWEDFTGVPPNPDGSPGLRRLIHRDDLQGALREWKRGVRSGDEFEIELRIRHRSGEHCWVLARTVPVHDQTGAIAEWYGTCTDIDDRVRAQQALRTSIEKERKSIEKERKRARQLKWTSEHDPLTRLPNRRAFEARLKEEINRASGRGTEIGLLLLDLDYFKHLNDTLGHGAGDELLRTLATRLRRSVRRQDFVARIGGDEFAVVVSDLKTDSDLAALGNGVAGAIQHPLNIGGHVVRPGVSIGGAIWPKRSSNADDFLKRADAALYALKRSGRGGFRQFESYMLDEVKEAAYQLTRAREAIANDTIVVHYQPKVVIRGGAAAGFEALLRYQSPQGALELPDTIAEAFNDYELAAKLGELMHQKVARDIRAWIDRDLPFGRVSINAAPAEFLRDDYAERLLCILDSQAVPPACIEVEVTEHAFVERGREYVARALDVLKSAGMTISLDDFGTGHSSLSHIRDFPVDLIKIDRSYTELIADDEEIAALVAGVIHLACTLGLEVVAEGVETRRQLELLRAMGCHYAQGYLLGVPVDGTRVPERILTERSIRSAA